MGLLPIIFTALTIFTISVVAIFTISYIVYKMRSPNKRITQPAVQIESYSIPGNTNLPSYEFIQDYPEPVMIPQPQIRRSNPITQNKNRFEVLNNLVGTNCAEYRHTQSYYKPVHNKSQDIFSNYSESNSYNLQAIRIQR